MDAESDGNCFIATIIQGHKAFIDWEWPRSQIADRDARIKRLEAEVERMRILLGEWQDEPKAQDDAGSAD